MPRQLENKAAVVTGAAGGLGQAIVRRFLDEGASVIGLDNRSSQPPAIDDARFVLLTGDVRSAADNERAVETALQRFGRLDTFVANAGIYDNRRPLREFTAVELDAGFDELFGINVKGYLQGARAALAALKLSRGSIIFTSSISGERAGFGGPLYVAAKHAINGLTRQLALELAPEVRVNAVAPGFVPTELKGLSSLGQEQCNAGPSAEQTLLKSIAHPDDLAAAYVFLASDACASTATGMVLGLDGGSSLRGPRA